jgi:hypothetical protein
VCSLNIKESFGLLTKQESALVSFTSRQEGWGEPVGRRKGGGEPYEADERTSLTRLTSQSSTRTTSRRCAVVFLISSVISFPLRLKC